jgi:hypothetical protein
MISTDDVTHQVQSRPKSGGAIMMRMTIAVAALIVVIVVTILRSRSSSIGLSSAANPPLQELHTMAGDQSLFRYFGSLSF